MSPRQRRDALLALQSELASLTFLDPACGSGNFLTETYVSLRRIVGFHSGGAGGSPANGTTRFQRVMDAQDAHPSLAGEPPAPRQLFGASGFPTKMTESECVAKLFRRYQALVAGMK